MKTSNFKWLTISSKLIFLGFIVLMISCAPKESNRIENPPKKEEKVEVTPPEEIEMIAEDSHSLPPAQSMESIPSSAEQKPQELKVVFTADSVMYLGQTGIMSIWLCAPDVDVAIS